jgi:hypothetical protein
VLLPSSNLPSEKLLQSVGALSSCDESDARFVAVAFHRTGLKTRRSLRFPPTTAHYFAVVNCAHQRPLRPNRNDLRRTAPNPNGASEIGSSGTSAQRQINR